VAASDSPLTKLPQLVHQAATGMEKPMALSSFQQVPENTQDLLGLRRSTNLLCRIGCQIPASVWIAYDILVSVLGLELAYHLSPQAGRYAANLTQYLCIATSVLIGGLVAGLYEKRFLRSFHDFGFVQIQASLIAILLFMLLVTVLLFGTVGRWIIGLTGLFIFIGGLIPRVLVHSLIRRFPMRVLLVSMAPDKSILAAKLRQERAFFTFVGFCTIDENGNGAHLGTVGDLTKLCRENQVDMVIIGAGAVGVPGVLQHCYDVLSLGCVLIDEVSFFEEFYEQIRVDHIDESWFLSSQVNISRRFPVLVKRLIDVALALLGLVLSMPLFPIIWLLVRFTSPGPALYSQTRYGQYGKEFTIYKFRSMVEGAEPAGEQWATDGDPRVTAVGGLLRKTRLDEIPQLYNILRGDMSFVGPRPERPEIQERIERELPSFYFRLLAPPGLTGLAQIRYKYAASLGEAKEKLQYDLYYIKNWSVILDISIIFRTILTLMRGSR
jgi:exopolysaccharide biosynthesis polyprenyl glycosylphosphotransferase